MIRKLIYRAMGAAAVAVSAYACSVITEPPMLNGEVGVPNLPGTIGCQVGHQGCDCSAEGVTAECGEVVRKSGAYVTCSMGHAVCAGGHWGPCVGERVEMQAEAASRGHGIELRVLEAAPAACSRCNPNLCTDFIDDFADASVAADGSAPDGFEVGPTGGGIVLQARLDADGGGAGDASTGARPYYNETTFTEDFSAHCGAGYQPKWRKFGFVVDIASSDAGSSSISVAVQSGADRSTLQPSVPLVLGSSKSSTPSVGGVRSWDSFLIDTSSLGFNESPAPNVRSGDILRAVVTLTPSPDRSATSGYQTPTLWSWEAESECLRSN